MKKIAIVGSAPSTVQLAPYKDPEWTVWACSPGAFPHAGIYADAWFELHRWEPKLPAHNDSGKPWFSAEYAEMLARFRGTVYMTDPLPPEIPNASRFPFEDLVEEFGPFLWTSTISWMLAKAIMTPGVKEIGLWGVDMSANEEYAHQRPACQQLLWEAKKRGIEVTVPPESDLLQPLDWYGASDTSPMKVKLTARLRELQGRLNHHQQVVSENQNMVHFLNGAIDDTKYMLSTWVTHQEWIQPKMGATGNEVRAFAPGEVNSHTLGVAGCKPLDSVELEDDVVQIPHGLYHDRRAGDGTAD